MLIVSYLFEN